MRKENYLITFYVCLIRKMRLNDFLYAYVYAAMSFPMSMFSMKDDSSKVHTNFKLLL